MVCQPSDNPIGVRGISSDCFWKFSTAAVKAITLVSSRLISTAGRHSAVVLLLGMFNVLRLAANPPLGGVLSQVNVLRKFLYMGSPLSFSSLGGTAPQLR